MLPDRALFTGLNWVSSHKLNPNKYTWVKYSPSIFRGFSLLRLKNISLVWCSHLRAFVFFNSWREMLYTMAMLSILSVQFPWNVQSCVNIKHSPDPITTYATLSPTASVNPAWIEKLKSLALKSTHGWFTCVNVSTYFWWQAWGFWKWHVFEVTT